MLVSSAGNRKDVMDLIARVESEGAQVVKAPNGHWKVTNPATGRSCQLSYSPRDPRYVYNAATRLKRIGLLT